MKKKCYEAKKKLDSQFEDKLPQKNSLRLRYSSPYSPPQEWELTYF